MVLFKPHLRNSFPVGVSELDELASPSDPLLVHLRVINTLPKGPTEHRGQKWQELLVIKLLLFNQSPNGLKVVALGAGPNVGWTVQVDDAHL